MNDITMTPIGVIRSPHRTPAEAPIQPVFAHGAVGRVELRPEFADGLRDLNGFSHVVLVYFMHLSEGYSLSVKPYLDDQERGLFATRAPRRPNPIGLSVVRLERIEGSVLHILDIDAVDGSPLLDLKPYVEFLDPSDEVEIGWLTGKTIPPPRK